MVLLRFLCRAAVLALLAANGAPVVAAPLSAPLAAPLAAPADGRARFAALLRQESLKAGLPFEVADAVAAIESGYDPTKIGGVGEIGLMQVRPGTAAMLGFRGSATALADPAVNIRYGVGYLAGAWRQANGDFCRALMKYRAGHGEETMTPLSVTYCARARAHLIATGSRLKLGPMPAAVLAAAARPASATAPAWPGARLTGAAFWAAHEARIRRLDAAVQRRWRKVASR